MANSLDIFTLAARKAVDLPENWTGYLFEKVDGQGVMVTGLVVTDTITRGPRKGEPNYRKGDLKTKRTVFVPTELFRSIAKAEGL